MGPLTSRYWVSATWYEAEPCAAEVQPPPNREWFRRLKVRFDWIETQGTPWWLAGKGGKSWVPPGGQTTQQPLAPTATSTETVTEDADMELDVTPSIEQEPQIQDRVPVTLSPTDATYLPQSASNSASNTEENCRWMGEGIKLPPTPLSPDKELPLPVIGVKPPIAMLNTPPTPPLDQLAPPAPAPSPPAPATSPPAPVPPTGGFERVVDTAPCGGIGSEAHLLEDREAPPEHVDDDIAWKRPPLRMAGPTPFDTMYFSPLDFHRGTRIPGDHLLANYHAPPDDDEPW